MKWYFEQLNALYGESFAGISRAAAFARAWYHRRRGRAASSTMALVYLKKRRRNVMTWLSRAAVASALGRARKRLFLSFVNGIARGNAGAWPYERADSAM